MADPYTKHQVSHLSSSTLSFSSTLLEEICRSIDQSTNDDDEEVVVSMRKKRDINHDNLRSVFKTEQEQMANYQRACMIEKWMEKKVTEKVVVRAKSMADLKVSRKDRQGSSSSSSDSSCGFFSSSETDSFPIPKPVRTGGGRNSEPDQKKPKHESRLIVKTKSRALKMYGDLKKIKQPISPGGKVAAFLNSIFTGKKPMGDLNASTASRSCLSKTTPSSSKAGKRSVRFSSDEETLHNKNNDVGFIRSGVDEEVTRRIMERTRKVEEALMNYQKKLGKCGRELEEEEENDLDAESCGSSDLFELDNLSAIGMEDEISLQYREELPVYETTNLDKIHTMQMG